MTIRLAIADTGGANLASLIHAFERLNVVACVTSSAAELHAATHVVLPGVGAAGPAMARLEAAGLVAALRELSCPVLGICLGMQLLYERSEEAAVPCLGILPGGVASLAPSPFVTVPHMGWNTVDATSQHALLDGVPSGTYAYFVHSYAAPLSENTIATSEHGVSFSAAVAYRNFLGVQFHPEKSSAAGARLLRNFVNL